MPVDFKKLLSKNMDDVKRPVPVPPGTYNGVVTKYTLDESPEKHTPYVRYMVQLTAPGPGIDPASMDGVDLSKKQLRTDFFLTDEAEYRLKKFAESCGIATRGQSMGAVIPLLMNAQVVVDVTQTPGKEDGEFYNNISSIKGHAAA